MSTKTTTKNRDKLEAALRSELDKLPEILSKLEPKDRINAITRLLPFVMTKPEQTVDEPGWFNL